MNKHKRSQFYSGKLLFNMKMMISEQKKEVIKMMNSSKQQMKETIMKTSPRGFTILFMLSSLPAFYYINQLVERQYNDPDFVNNSNKFYKYYYLYNLVFSSCAIFLSTFNYNNPSTLYSLRKRSLRMSTLPFFWNFIGLMIPQTDNKHIIWPAILAQISTFISQSKMVSIGSLPAWFYSYRHYLGLFYLFMIIINYNAISRYNKRIISHPHQFLDIKKENQKILI